MPTKGQLKKMLPLVMLVCAACVEIDHTEEASIPPEALVSAQIPTDGEQDDSASEDAGSASQAPNIVLESKQDVVRFLSRSTFGGKKSDIDELMNVSAAAWLDAEFSKPASLTLPSLQALPRTASGNRPNRVVNELYWDHIVSSDDQLRQRMAFALSQILVYSNVGNVGDQDARGYYQDILIRNAFGNYRDLLEEVTYSPAMGAWLTYLHNDKGDPATGRMPDENYAREILQLFSIGLIELNRDGTPKLDATGQTIETYSNRDIQGLARVFTGLSYAGGQFNRRPNPAPIAQPMQMYDDHHSLLEKAFLDTVIPAGTTGERSIDMALDAIFEHENLAPFISRQLIQRFSASNPSPEYVERVATVFEEGTFSSSDGYVFGTGQRGDLAATLAAVLLDPSLFEPIADESVGVFGKVREPVLRFTHWARAFDVSGIDARNEWRLQDTTGAQSSLGQQAFVAPTVFNFYRPGFVAPGTRSGENNMTVPEFQIVNENSHIGYMNFMTDFAFDRALERDPNFESYKPDYSEEVALSDTPSALIEHLDDLLTGGRMTEFEKDQIIDIIATMPINVSSTELAEQDRYDIVHVAVAMVINSPSYTVTW